MYKDIIQTIEVGNVIALALLIVALIFSLISDYNDYINNK